MAIAVMMAWMSVQTSASSAPSPEPSIDNTQIVVSGTTGAGITVQQLTCDVSIDNPHYSSGAPGV